MNRSSKALISLVGVTERYGCRHAKKEIGPVGIATSPMKFSYFPDARRFFLASAKRSAASNVALSYTAEVVLVLECPATFAASSVATPPARASDIPLARRSRAHTLDSMPAAFRSLRQSSPKKVCEYGRPLATLTIAGPERFSIGQ